MSKPKKTHIRFGEFWGLGLVALSIFLGLALSSYHPNDISYYLNPPNSPCQNLMGPVGAWSAFILYFLLGLTAYLVPVTALFWGIFKLRRLPLKKRPDIYIFAWCLATISLCGLLALAEISGYKPHIMIGWKLTGLGGLVGIIIGEHFLVRYFGNTGSALIMIAVCTISLFYITELRFWLLLKWIINTLVKGINGLYRLLQLCTVSSVKTIRKWRLRKKQLKPKARPSPEIAQVKPLPVPPGGKEKFRLRPLPVSSQPPAPEPARRSPGRDKEEGRAQQAPVKEPGSYRLPPVDILEPPPPVKERGTEDLSQGAKVLESTLKEFGINVRVTNIQRGPVVTLYEIVLAPGTKVGKITSLADDIALSMRVATVRIFAPIPGKAAVGIEVPNVKPRFVFLKEVLDSSEFQGSKAKIPLALGMDISGNTLVADLTEMPHLLIAGTTGSGKTVCLNAIILSILFKLGPGEVKFLMVDPKMVELAPFKNIPHLLVPVVHQPKKAALGLTWVVREMERRYELFARVGVRNIQGYNIRPDKEEAGKKITEMTEGLLELDYEKETPASLPYIVIIIDELADLMMVAAADIETAIGRLAQLSRAVGIHIILATQRPSVDVLTGVIKANFSTRISFQVASRVDSRTVLDAGGANMLLGKGDLLFMPPGSSKLIRAQATLVRDIEISRVVDFITSQKKAKFTTSEVREGIFHKLKEAQRGEEADDPLFQQAVDVILITQQPSVSILQRKLRIGYNRAARIVDLMEDQGIIGPLQDGKREILVDRSELKK